MSKCVVGDIVMPNTLFYIVCLLNQYFEIIGIILDLNLITCHFLSLIILANQHTIVELVTFFRSMFPAEALSSPSKVTTKKSESERDQTVLSGREVRLLTKDMKLLYISTS